MGHRASVRRDHRHDRASVRRRRDRGGLRSRGRARRDRGEVSGAPRLAPLGLMKVDRGEAVRHATTVCNALTTAALPASAYKRPGEKLRRVLSEGMEKPIAFLGEPM